MNEQQIEQALIEKLGDLKYTYRPDIRGRAALEQNFRKHFEALNRVNLADSEFHRLLDQIVSPDVFANARHLRNINSFERDDGTPLNYTLVNLKDWCKNSFENILLSQQQPLSSCRYSIPEETTMSDFMPYTTIDDGNGYIYKHTEEYGSGDWAGYVQDNSVYNWHGDYLGYAGNNGNVYDANNHVIGWMDSTNGHVYNSAGVQVYDTTHGVVGAAAYLLCVYQGNVP